MHKVSLKFHQRGVTQKLRKAEIFFVRIAIKFHEDIPYGYLVMACTRTVWKKKSNQRESNNFCKQHAIVLIHIAMKFIQIFNMVTKL